jgi:hypothetical protein
MPIATVPHMAQVKPGSRMYASMHILQPTEMLQSALKVLPCFPPMPSSPPEHFQAFLIASNCFNMRLFASMNLSTQFCMQGSSYLSSLPDDGLEVIHLRKHMSVREWIAIPES